MRIFWLGFLRTFEKIISQNHIFFFEEKWLILAGKMGDVSVWSLTSKTEYHICRSYAPHERGTLPQLAADCGCRQNLSHSYPRTWYSRVRSCEQSGFSALKYNNNIIIKKQCGIRLNTVLLMELFADQYFFETGIQNWIWYIVRIRWCDSGCKQNGKLPKKY